MGVAIEYREPTVFSCEIPVRITELSAAGHLGFDHLVGMLNEASARFLDQRGIRRKQGGIGAIYVDLSVNYRAEAFWRDTLTIDVALGDVGEKRFELLFRITREQRSIVVALAEIGVLLFDYDRRQVVPIPKGLL